MDNVAVGAAQSYIEGELGGPTTESDKVETLTTTEKKIVDNDPESVGLLLLNLGSDTAYVFYDDTVSASKGIKLFPNGGMCSMNIRGDFTLPTRAWYGIAETTTTTILALRVRRYALT